MHREIAASFSSARAHAGKGRQVSHDPTYRFNHTINIDKHNALKKFPHIAHELSTATDQHELQPNKCLDTSVFVRIHADIPLLS